LALIVSSTASLDDDDAGLWWLLVTLASYSVGLEGEADDGDGVESVLHDGELLWMLAVYYSI
jgi:hypothetical protein